MEATGKLSKQLHTVHIRNLAARSTKIAMLELETQIGDKTRNINWFCDTGAEVCVMSRC